MYYEGPIYRPPSEAFSLLVQATVGCPHNKCSFCMIYKKGPAYKVRPVAEIKADLDEAAQESHGLVRTLFFPAGNTIAMPTAQLAEICQYAREIFPRLERITVYGSSAYIDRKSDAELRELKAAGLTRIHVGLESGDDQVLALVKKGVTGAQQARAGQKVIAAGIQLSLYVLLGLGGEALTEQHARHTARVLNEIGQPDFIRLRTLVPKVNTLLLHQIERGRFKLLEPHQVLTETRMLIADLTCEAELTSDHYTNYVDLKGTLPRDKDRILSEIDRALDRPEGDFRPHFIGEQ